MMNYGSYAVIKVADLQPLQIWEGEVLLLTHNCRDHQQTVKLMASMGSNMENPQVLTWLCPFYS